ncbi:MAG: hypothetical protein J0M11_15510 [Anaerolineae bacterium]|nr:hypothetical protein [Anaerolineae bacterium]
MGRSIPPEPSEAEEMLGGFYDTAYAYRFGEPKHDVSCATLRDKEGNFISQQFLFPLQGLRSFESADVEHTLQPSVDGSYQLTLHSNIFLYAVQIICDGFLPDDNYFHLVPNETRVITLFPRESINVNPYIQITSANIQDIQLR